MPKRPRYILLPISWLYGGIIHVRNRLFDKKIFRSATFDFPLICIGNLSFGGTGKTPMIEYLVNLLGTNYEIATLSRGYKRTTKGFLIADSNSEATEIGDEPMQIHQKFPKVTVAVAEERVIGIPKLLFAKPATQVILLDDAFQHREVSAGLNLLLTDYNNLYSKDYLFPAGNLRDIKKSSKRADIIVVTKCKSNLTIEKKQSIINELAPVSSQKIFFAEIRYKQPYHLFSKEPLDWQEKIEALVVCGIANPQSLEQEIRDKIGDLKMMKFKDHHAFGASDITHMLERFSKMHSANKIIITTEKDATRLLDFEAALKAVPIFVLPMTHQFLFGQQKEFETEILDFVRSFDDKVDLHVQ